MAMPSHDDIVNEIRTFLRKNMPAQDGDALTDDATIWDVIDSLLVLHLVRDLEERFSFSVAPEDMIPENFQTIRAITAYVQAQCDSKES
jgi:acyl carrier protein